MANKKIHVIGGGTFFDVRAHWAAAGDQTRLASCGTLDGTHTHINIGFRVRTQPKK